MSESDWRPYVVQQGDHLHKLAFRSGCEADAAWAHASNADLRAHRASMNLLCPGDVLHLPSAPGPGLELRARSHNRYRVKMPTVRVALALQQPSGPMANEPFEVRGVHAAGEPLRGNRSRPPPISSDLSNRAIPREITGRREGGKDLKPLNPSCLPSFLFKSRPLRLELRP